jgi:predicted nucleotidyltransferase component of viral defense system
MTDIEAVLQDLKKCCLKSQIPYLLIGGIANIFHGSARVTRDIDIIVFVDYREKKKVLEAFEKEFRERVRNPLTFLEKHFVLPLMHKASEMEVDVSLGFSEFEKKALNRSKKLKLGRTELNVCSAEDLILFKLVASRPRDLLDVQELMSRYQGKLDITYLRSCAKDFLEIDRGDVAESLETFLVEHYLRKSRQ